MVIGEPARVPPVLPMKLIFAELAAVPTVIRKM